MNILYTNIVLFSSLMIYFSYENAITVYFTYFTSFFNIVNIITIIIWSYSTFTALSFGLGTYSSQLQKMQREDIAYAPKKAEGSQDFARSTHEVFPISALFKFIDLHCTARLNHASQSFYLFYLFPFLHFPTLPFLYFFYQSISFTSSSLFSFWLSYFHSSLPIPLFPLLSSILSPFFNHLLPSAWATTATALCLEFPYRGYRAHWFLWKCFLSGTVIHNINSPSLFFCILLSLILFPSFTVLPTIIIINSVSLLSPYLSIIPHACNIFTSSISLPLSRCLSVSLFLIVYISPSVLCSVLHRLISI